MKNQRAILFNDVSKRYLIGPKYYPSLREWIASFFSKEFFKGKDSFYALRKLNISIDKGESVGLVGPNGAGKTTILKLISKVTAPTSGEIVVDGRVAGLLELGAGFHPELTGRENILFQGTVLGMSRQEIEDKTDDIISFAGLGEFINSPIKQFSSGMHARLGFSIAIHLQPDILLIDEVLAVGDQGFREKSYRKIESFCKDSEKTIVIASHSLPMITRLCERVFWIDKGAIVQDGKPKSVLERYTKNLKG